MLPCRLKDQVECPSEDFINQGSTGEAAEPVEDKIQNAHTHTIHISHEELAYSMLGTG